MNWLKRMWNKDLLKKTIEDCNLAGEKTSVSPYWFKDGYKVKNIKHSVLIEKIKDNVLMIFNESTGADYNHIEKKRHDLYITRVNYYTEAPGTHVSNLETYTKKIKGIDLQEVNCLFVSGTSGCGKTTLVKSILKSCSMPIEIYSPKAEEDYPEFQNKKEFDEIEILSLTEKIKRFNDDKEYRKQLAELIVIDEFLLLSNINFAKGLINELNRCLAFNRSSQLKFIFISQSINKQQLNSFNVSIVNTFLLNLKDIQNYQSSIGEVLPKYRHSLPRGKFLKKSLDDGEEILWIN